MPLSHQNAVVICDVSFQTYSLSFQDPSFALNQHCSLLELLQLSETVNKRATEACVVIGEKLDTHLGRQTLKRPPDPRMNRLSQTSHSLSEGRPFLSTLFVTRPVKIVPGCLLDCLSARFCCDICMYRETPPYTSIETVPLALTGSLHAVTDWSDPANQSNSASTTPVLESSNLRTPSSWPASSTRAAIRYVCPCTLVCFGNVSRSRLATGR